MIVLSCPVIIKEVMPHVPPLRESLRALCFIPIIWWPSADLDIRYARKILSVLVENAKAVGSCRALQHCVPRNDAFLATPPVYQQSKKEKMWLSNR
jgi:hypothetical protein